MSAPSRARAAERLHRTAIGLLRRLRVSDVDAGIGPARLSALSVLVFGGPRTLGALARAEQVRPPTMTRIVTGLVDAGLARRRADPADARSARISATPKGRRLLERARGARLDALETLLERLSPSELRALETGIAALERELSDART